MGDRGSWRERRHREGLCRGIMVPRQGWCPVGIADLPDVFKSIGLSCVRGVDCIRGLIIIWNVLPFGQAKGFIPGWVIEIDLCTGGDDGLEPVVVNHMILTCDFPGI